MFPEILTEARSLVLERINSLINAESKVSDSMLYTSTAESKMIRSALLITASKKNTCLTKSSAINLATSIELLHSYSLIHDDLPSMDNDNIRRGKDSNHIKYGEAIAILSGDALQTLAFEVITNDDDLDSDLKISAISLLTDACGYKGMVLGQELDCGIFTCSLLISHVSQCRIHYRTRKNPLRKIVSNWANSLFKAVGDYRVNLRFCPR